MSPEQPLKLEVRGDDPNHDGWSIVEVVRVATGALERVIRVPKGSRFSDRPKPLPVAK